VTRTLFAILLACAAVAPRIAAAEFQPDLPTLSAVPRVELPAAAVRKALARPIKSEPYQFAVPVDLSLAPEQGAWRELGALRSWRLRLRSQGARSLSVQLAAPLIPEGGALWVYDPAARDVRGPYGPDRIGDSGLWTAPVEGEELVLEIVAPAGSAIGLGGVQVFHGFRDWKATMVPAAQAGSCNIDVTCASASAWTQEAGSVARISIGGAYLCSGQLVNNVRQDERRLFLTANHCGVDGASGPADSVIFYFNYTGQCGDGDSDPVPAPTFEGARRLAHDVQSDFSLLLITDLDPLPAGIYFAGWDASGTGASSGVSIHHPLGDEKKISFFDQPATHGSVNVGVGCAIDAWQVGWSSGTTEAGSSGGGLWNSSHRLIGVLSGGSASCDNLGGTDYFARLDRGWTASSRTDGQLKAHLDPDNTCVAIVPGLDPDSPAPGAVAATQQNTKCEGQASNCSGGGGGALDLLSLALLALARRRRR
jgi:lysyl endopeptidase